MNKTKNKIFNERCTIAKIKGCKGIIIGIERDGYYNPEIKEFLNDMKTEGYNIYYLRHGDLDWLKPVSISDKPVVLNQCGWFITKEEIKFKSFFNKSKEIHEKKITKRNSSYYRFSNKGLEKAKEYIYAKDMILIFDYIRQANKITDLMR